MTSVTARGAAAGDELFAAECHTTVAAVAGFYPDSCFIDEHCYSTEQCNEMSSNLSCLTDFSGLFSEKLQARAVGDWYTGVNQISSLRPITETGEGNLECEKQEVTK